MGRNRESLRACKNSNEFMAFMKGKAWHHTEYCHYTRLNVIEKILKNGELWLLPSDGFNDKADNEKNTFLLCFSTGTAENLALWYMYSGVDGKGGRIRFTKSYVKAIYENAKFFLCEKGKECSEGIELERDIHIEVKLKDVVYMESSEKKRKCVIRYNNESNFNLPCDAYDEIKSCGDFSIKKPVWYYEKETRLAVKLTQEGEKFLKPEAEYKIILQIPTKILKKIKIEFAPEIVKDRLEILNLYPYIKEYRKKSGNVNFSKFSGEVEMKLMNKVCEDCKQKNIKYIENSEGEELK